MSIFPELPDWAVPGPAPAATVKTADLRRQVNRLDTAQSQIPPASIDITQINNTTITTLSGGGGTTPTLDAVPAPVADVSLANHKITTLADAVNPQDAMNQRASDARYATIGSGGSPTLDAVPAPVANVSFASHKATLLADATGVQDAMNQRTSDARYAPIGRTLNAVPAPTANVSFAGFKATLLADATGVQDAMNQRTSDARYAPIGRTLDAVPAPVADVSFASHKATLLADATNPQDAMNQRASDARYAAIGSGGGSPTLDAVPAPVADVSLANHKITTLADATAAQDAMNQRASDARYAAIGVLKWNQMFERTGFLGSAASASSYIVGIASNVAATGVGNSNTSEATFYIDPAFYQTGSQMCLASYVITDNVAPAANFAFSLRPVATWGGTSATPTVASIGAAVTGTAATINAPAAGGPSVGKSTAVAIPATAGWYVISFTLSAVSAVNSFEAVGGVLMVGQPT